MPLPLSHALDVTDSSTNDCTRQTVLGKPRCCLDICHSHMPPTPLLQIAVTDMLFRKSLRLSQGGPEAGTIANLMSNDAGRIWNLPQYLHILWSGPFQIMVVMGMLVRVR
jgi:hypothetical protein